MAKIVEDAVLDAAFAEISSNAIRMHVCEGQPTTITTGTLSGGTFVNELAVFTIAGGDFTTANGDTNGRKVTVAAQTGASITTSGTADHLVLSDNNNRILYITTIASQAITSGGTVDTSAWDIEIADPT